MPLFIFERPPRPRRVLARDGAEDDVEDDDEDDKGEGAGAMKPRPRPRPRVERPRAGDDDEAPFGLEFEFDEVDAGDKEASSADGEESI